MIGIRRNPRSAPIFMLWRCWPYWAVFGSGVASLLPKRHLETSEPILCGWAIYSIGCYDLCMSSRGGLLREVMLETSTTQSELSRVSGVHQPSISQFLSEKVELTDEQLDR